MATSTAIRVGVGRYEFEAAGLVVPVSNGPVYELPVAQVPCTICLEVENTHQSVALTAFGLEARDHSNGEWWEVLGGTDWQDTTIPLLACASDDPTTLASGQKVHIWLDCRVPTSLRLSACAASEGQLAIRGTMQEL